MDFLTFVAKLIGVKQQNALNNMSALIKEYADALRFLRSNSMQRFPLALTIGFCIT